MTNLYTWGIIAHECSSHTTVESPGTDKINVPVTQQKKPEQRAKFNQIMALTRDLHASSDASVIKGFGEWYRSYSLVGNGRPVWTFWGDIFCTSVCMYAHHRKNLNVAGGFQNSSVLHDNDGNALENQFSLGNILSPSTFISATFSLLLHVMGSQRSSRQLIRESGRKSI